MQNILVKIGIVFGLIIGFSLAYYSVSHTIWGEEPESPQANNSLIIDDAFTKAQLRQFVQLSYAPDALQFSSIYQHIDRWLPAVNLTPLPDDSRLWFKLELTHIGQSPIDLSLVVDNNTLDYVDVYVVDEYERIINTYNVGARRLQTQKLTDTKGFSFPFTLRPSQSATLIVGVIDDGAMVFPIELWEQQALDDTQSILLVIYSGFIGALCVMFTYFLISYVLQRCPVRFWFSLSCIAVTLTFLSVEGVTIPWQTLHEHRESICVVLVAFSLFTLTKVAHGMQRRTHVLFKVVNFSIPILLLLFTTSLSTYHLLLAAVVSIPVALGFQILLTLIYTRKNQLAMWRFLLFGWILLLAGTGLELVYYLQSKSMTTTESLVTVSLIMLSALSFAFAIESRERAQTSLASNQKSKRINDLKVFYNLFRNSAEGLYTSALDGVLMSANPAMCKLFGYVSEAEMISQISNTQDFYAYPEDRDLLIGELLRNDVILGREIKGKRSDGSEFWFSISCQLHRDADTPYIYGSIFDVTERKQSNISLEYLASHDSLTGVYNRREFEFQLHKTLQNLCDTPGVFSLLFIDLDRFKVVNDTCGHRAGDQLLKEISQLLQKEVQQKGLLARLGGDEFAVLLPGYDDTAAYLIAMQLLNAVQGYRFIWENRFFTLGVSIGLVSSNDAHGHPEQIISMADAACYLAKENGRNQIHRYSSEDKNLQRYVEELSWISQLNKALEQDNFELYYQHYMPLRKKADGNYYEVLVRMKTHDNEEENIVSPNSFLPTAERYDLSAKIDRWVIENTFSWLAANPDHLANLNRCNINLSGHSMADKDLKLLIINAFEKYAIAYDKICFEITETMAIVKMEDTLAFIATFKKLGCLFALDDFGSGFSSYAYLKNLPVDVVKIDGAFIKDILTDKVDLAMVASIKDIANAMGMETVGEFVETPDIMAQIGKMGIDYAQGFAIAEPKPLSEFTPL